MTTTRRLIAAFKTSIDARAEGADGYADWVEAWSEDYGLTPEIDACVLGGGMYPGYEAYWTQIQQSPTEPHPMRGGSVPSAAEVAWAELATTTPHYVVSTSLSTAAWPNTRFLTGLDQLAELKGRPGASIYLMGGPRILAGCLEAHLVDELRLIVHPLVAGAGAPLFPAPSRHSMRLLSAEQIPGGRLSLRYRVD